MEIVFSLLLEPQNGDADNKAFFVVLLNVLKQQQIQIKTFK
jgi:hypothetical protein